LAENGGSSIRPRVAKPEKTVLQNHPFHLRTLYMMDSLDEFAASVFWNNLL